MGFEVNAENISKLHWFSVKELLPYKSHMFTLVGHIDHNNDHYTLIVKIGMFNPLNNTWAKIGDRCTVNGKEGWKIEDITNWVDCWAEVPQEEFE